MNTPVRKWLNWLPPSVALVVLVLVWTAFLSLRPVAVADLLFEPNRRIESKIVWQDWQSTETGAENVHVYIREGQLGLMFHNLTVRQEKRVQAGATEFEPYSVQSKLRPIPVALVSFGGLVAAAVLTILWVKLVSFIAKPRPESVAGIRENLV